MKTFVALALLASAAVAAVPPRCPNGNPAKLSGDAFSPVECSTTTKKLAELPGTPAESPDERALKELSGRWEGHLVAGLGRYALLLEVKTRLFGRADVVLQLKEQQFRERLTDSLALKPADGKGVWDAELTSSLAPGVSLAGTLRLGSAPAEPEKPGAAPAPPERQADLLFSNGAAHRVRWTKDADKLKLRIHSAVPGAPLQSFALELSRTKRESL